jgi:hypothetical protein
MKINKEELKKIIIESIEDDTAVYIIGHNDQIEVHTCMYKWTDGYYHDEPEKNRVLR